MRLAFHHANIEWIQSTKATPTPATTNPKTLLLLSAAPVKGSIAGTIVELGPEEPPEALAVGWAQPVDRATPVGLAYRVGAAVPVGKYGPVLLVETNQWLSSCQRLPRK